VIIFNAWRQRRKPFAELLDDSVLDKVPQIAEVLVHIEPEEELIVPAMKR
jgi:hypothetical protein